MSAPRQRPELPEGREPINGGLLYIQIVAGLLIVGIVIVGCWGLWLLVALVEAL